MNKELQKNNHVRVHECATETRAYHTQLRKLNAKIKHRFGEKYMLHRAFYLDMNTPIKVCCRTHGFFWVTPKALVKHGSKGCPKCQEPKPKPYTYQGKKYTPKSYKQAVEKLHSEKYDLSSLRFKGFEKKTQVKCKIHNYTIVRNAKTFLSEKFTCPKCKGEIEKLSQSEFEAKANLKHNNLYSYENAKYTGTRQPVQVTCKIHGDFTVNRAGDHYIGGTGCPSCKSGGFNVNLPAILYYISVENGRAYKIGITNSTVEARFSGELQKIRTLKTWSYEIGKDAKDKEQEIINTFKLYKYKGAKLLNSGHTEMFYRDVLDLDREE